jgi:hypothetical protein
MNAWEFDLPDGLGHVSVHPGTGRWAQRITISTGELGKGVYVYDATWKKADGTVSHSYMERSQLRRYRKFAPMWAAQAATQATATMKGGNA